jgi:uncharacterized protein with beta-barrel porin domain
VETVNLTGGGANGTLTGATIAETFNLTGNESGNVAGLNFSGVNTINAGDGDDILNFGATQALGLDFNGQGGSDTINITSSVTLTTDNLDAEFLNIGANTVGLTGNNLVDTIAVDNSGGTLNINGSETVGTYSQSGAAILGGAGTLTATTATLNGGTVTGNLNGTTSITSNGTVGVSGKLGGGSLFVTAGILTLNGQSDNSDVTVSNGAALRGTGIITNDLQNNGVLSVGSAGGILRINGNLMNAGSISLNVENVGKFEKVVVRGNVDFGGSLNVTNTGSGLLNGEQVLLFDAATYSGNFSTSKFMGFKNDIIFVDVNTGILTALGNGGAKKGRTFLNLNESQTSTFLSLYEDAIRLGIQDVTVTDTPPGDFNIGFSNAIDKSGDRLLDAALKKAITNTPGTIDAATINRLSPEVHRGMVDYTEQALRAHVREGVNAAPISQAGATQVFATVSSTFAGAESLGTNADYDTEMVGVTAGIRHNVDQNLQVGMILGADEGSIDGALIDTDAQGIVFGVFGRYVADEASKTLLTASLSYGANEYDALRRTFGVNATFSGNATANGIESDALEFAIGLSTVAYEEDNFRIRPNAGIRYLTGSVDSFNEVGPGVNLAVDGQDIDSLLLELGVNFEYDIQDNVSLFGHLGYVTDFEDSDNTVSARFASSGAAGRPFGVNAPGIDDEAFIIELGGYYDINQNTRLGMNYRGELRADSQSTYTIGVGASYSF